jgi:hypothetical protein
VIQLIVDVNKYNILRMAMMDRNLDNSSEEIDFIHVPPQTFAIKKVVHNEVLAAAAELLLDKKIFTKITPYQVIQDMRPTDHLSGLEFLALEEYKPPLEVALYVMMCFAVCIQQKWIKYSTVVNGYYADCDNPFVKEYLQDIHGKWIR